MPLTAALLDGPREALDWERLLLDHTTHEVLDCAAVFVEELGDGLNIADGITPNAIRLCDIAREALELAAEDERKWRLGNGKK